MVQGSGPIFGLSCRNADEPIYPENLRMSYVSDGTVAKKKGYKHSDRLTMEEVGAMI